MTHAGEPQGAAERPARPAADLCRTSGAVGILVDLPGVRREGVRLTLEGRDLLVEAEVAGLPGTAYGEPGLPRRYRRLFTLPEAVDPGRVQARLRDGVLVVVLPIREAGSARTIPIEEG